MDRRGLPRRGGLAVLEDAEADDERFALDGRFDGLSVGHDVGPAAGECRTGQGEQQRDRGKGGGESADHRRFLQAGDEAAARPDRTNYTAWTGSVPGSPGSPGRPSRVRGRG